MLKISEKVIIPSREIDINAVRSQGAGGQNVNKVATAIHLRFDIKASSLPDFYQEKLLKLRDSRISKDGVVIIKAQNFRTQEQNKEDALKRLLDLIKNASLTKKRRFITKPTKGAKKKRMDRKAKRGQLKALRRKVDYD
ncbi:protein chain release factor B [Xenococcus sp. PCC 7305]|uniref:alternative ribosome rescue aminoacyl-tRNA hydrolase ArfB n=1 Tax=Xenococcus sp. PCC 7305 TaxID=102125 RepID=UPI0002AD13B5|nr:alternative ribosome rescue aminoacyl-tRNA hydrolase ArfB [Xenococcus sp. PCC 7305]ELS05408.1 protein chain release factor B [Xenococcus sp. PCC 7305]